MRPPRSLSSGNTGRPGSAELQGGRAELQGGRAELQWDCNGRRDDRGDREKPLVTAVAG
jgi:hypothetical protein